ncbi:MAG: transcription antitermination factor NusB [Methylophilaceae bacterium]|nr:transcription antitermination factor NusB [Methylophilaceae bacterium]
MSENITNPSPAKPEKTGKSRRKSRELVLKAIYRGLLNKGELSQIRRDAMEDPDYTHADVDYFRLLLEGVHEQMVEIDSHLIKYTDRNVSALSPIEHAILYISAYELLYDPSIPYRVAINEGVELAKRFGGTDGHKYVNGVLDKLAAKARPSELAHARVP